MKCENCCEEHDGSYGSGRFCSSKCARGYATKAKRKAISLKVSNTLSSKELNHDRFLDKICKLCNEQFTVPWNKRAQKYCSKKCCCEDNQERFQEAATIAARKRCKKLSERIRLRNIGRKGGFGKKGYTVKGTRYESTIEKHCFEFLEEAKISFEPHKYIPESSKVSDVYIPSLDLWIEIDGIDRERRKKWLGKNYQYWQDKLKIYKERKMNFVVVKSKEEFKQLFVLK